MTIQQLGYSMIQMMLVKFMMNDLPHLSGMIPNPGKYVPPEEKYRLVKHTRRGSLIVVTKADDMAKLEVTNFEDMQAISRLLSASGIEWKTRRGVSKPVWEDASPLYREKRGAESIRLGLYPGSTIEFDFLELERVMAELNKEYPLLSESRGELHG